MDLPLSLPQSLHRYFWEVDPQKVNPQLKTDYVISRLLEKGNRGAVAWVMKNFPEDRVKVVIKQRRGFSPKTANFWSNFFQIPSQEVRCLQKFYLKQRKSHWPF